MRLFWFWFLIVGSWFEILEIGPRPTSYQLAALILIGTAVIMRFGREP